MAKAKINLKNIIAYIQGNWRYYFYYSYFPYIFIRKHIREQIEYRINSMDKACYVIGQCILCGCKTTALQMANKACDKPCYPKMLNAFEWKQAKNSGFVFPTDKATDYFWKINTKEKKFIKTNYKNHD